MTNALHSSQQLSNQFHQLMRAFNIQPGQWPDWQSWRLQLLDFIAVDDLILSGPAEYQIGVPATQMPAKSADSIKHTIGDVTIEWYFDTKVDSKVSFQLQQIITDWLPVLTSQIRIASKHCRNLAQKALADTTLNQLGYQYFAVSRNGKLTEPDNQSRPTFSVYQPKLLDSVKHWLAAIQPGKLPTTHPIRHKVMTVNEQRWLATLIFPMPPDKRPSDSRPANQALSLTMATEHREDVIASLVLVQLDNQTTPEWLTQAFAVSSSEARVMMLFASGKSAESVADHTGYSINTVYSYIKKMYAALGINKQGQLTACLAPRLI